MNDVLVLLGHWQLDVKPLRMANHRMLSTTRAGFPAARVTHADSECWMPTTGRTISATMRFWPGCWR